MFAKTIISLIIIGAVAGGVVYYGTQNPDFASIDVPLPRKKVVSPPPEPLKPNLQNPTVAEPSQESPHVSKVLPSETEPEIAPKDVIALVNIQIEKLSDEDMRDQANLDVVNYALRHNLMDEARFAMIGIGQIEIRETARSRIAVALAKAGEIEDAFKLIDQVEIEGLRDVMRLQVIEAITVPNFPTMQ